MRITSTDVVYTLGVIFELRFGTKQHPHQAIVMVLGQNGLFGFDEFLSGLSLHADNPGRAVDAPLGLSGRPWNVVSQRSAHIWFQIKLEHLTRQELRFNYLGLIRILPWKVWCSARFPHRCRRQVSGAWIYHWRNSKLGTYNGASSGTPQVNICVAVSVNECHQTRGRGTSPLIPRFCEFRWRFSGSIRSRIQSSTSMAPVKTFGLQKKNKKQKKHARGAWKCHIDWLNNISFILF